MALNLFSLSRKREVKLMELNVMLPNFEAVLRNILYCLLCQINYEPLFLSFLHVHSSKKETPRLFICKF